jgi:NYN domain
MSLALDTLELALTRQADHFVIATSDRDLALVALRLSELGIPVTGIGKADTNAAFRKACRDFVALPESAPVSGAAVKLSPAKGPFEDRLVAFLKGEGAQTEGWVSLNVLGQQKAQAAGISKSAAGMGKSASWLDWFKKHASRFQVKGTGSSAQVKATP